MSQRYNENYEQAPGKLISPATVITFLLILVAFAVIGVRLVFGIGPVSALSDGYPWGVWLAYDVATGTAFACGGYAIAIICYIMNNWKYHPFMRAAIVCSMFGYALAGFSVLVDIGRYWNAYNFFVPGQWNGSSVMLEVGLCVMAYTVVLIIEFVPSVLEKLGEMKDGIIKNTALFFASILDKVLVFIVAIGITLPTMHQSSLGSLFIISGDKLFPLWQSSFLPLLFVTNALMMGFAIIIFESSLSTVGFKRPYEREALEIARFIPYVAGFWLVVRGISLITSGGIMYIFSSPFHTFWFVLEIGLVVYAVIIFSERFTPVLTPPKAFYTAMLFGLGGGIYRFNVYMIGYDPGLNWNAYFPTIPEFMLTFGLIALEICAYIILARLLNLLPKPHAAH